MDTLGPGNPDDQSKEEITMTNALRNTSARRYLAVLLAVAGVAVLSVAVVAATTGANPADGQTAYGQGGPAGFGGPGGGPGMEGGPGMGGGRGIGGPGMGGAAAIAVADGKVFVVQGPALYRFDAGSLELEAQAELPRPEPRDGGPERGLLGQ
jgi:hypothetical protein